MLVRRGLVSLAFVIVACSSTPPPNPESPTPSAAKPAATKQVPREAFVAGITKAFCDNTAPCCTAAGAQHDPAVCAKRVAKELGWKEIVDNAKQYDGTHAEKCFAEVAALAKKCAGGSGEVLQGVECRSTFTAGKKTGEGCDQDVDCAPPPNGHSICWKGAMVDAPGRCAVITPPKLGAACFTPLGTEDKAQLYFSDCTDDPKMRCDPATNQCGPRVKSGGACEQIYECEVGSACVGKKCTPMTGAPCRGSNNCAEKQACIDGHCGPGKKLGDKCSDISDCAEGSCTAVTQRCGPWASMFLCK